MEYYFPSDTFQSILGYCDDRMEQRQRRTLSKVMKEMDIVKEMKDMEDWVYILELQYEDGLERTCGEDDDEEWEHMRRMEELEGIIDDWKYRMDKLKMDREEIIRQ